MSAIALFNFEHREVRVLLDDQGQPWFVAADVCAALGIANPRDAVGRLKDKEKGVGTTDTPGGQQQVTTVSESGVYRLVFTSRVEGAERFKDWLSEKVLPAIRKTGTYSVESARAFPVPTTFSGALRLAAELQERVEQQQAQISAQAPKVEAHDRYLEASGSISLRDAAKVLGMREQAFVNQLLRDGILYRTPGENGRLRAYADHEKAGRFLHRAGTAKVSSKAYTQVRVTPEGVDWLSRRYRRADAELVQGGAATP